MFENGRDYRARALLTLAGLASLTALAACASRGDNGVGVAFIDEQAADREVVLTEIGPPDSTTDFQAPGVPATVGQGTTLIVGARTGYRLRSLVRYTASSFPDSGTVVDSAFVSFFFRNEFGDGPLSMSVHRTTKEWFEGRIPFDSLPTFTAAADTIDVPFRDVTVDTVTFRLDDFVRFWVDHPDSNFGLLLEPLAGQTDEVEFGSRESLDGSQLTIHTPDGAVTPPVDRDTWSLQTVVPFMTLAGDPGHLTISNGLPVRSLVRFDVPDFGDRATINRAELLFRVDDTASAYGTMRCGFQRATGPWQDDSTEVEAILYGIRDVESGADSLSFDVTSLLRVLQTQDNEGFLFRSSDERRNTDYLRVHGGPGADPALAPKLRVWYTPGDEIGGTP
ncbi:MAG: DNRLRE domain-containing protein [bacterium]